MTEYNIYWSDLKEEAQERLKGLYHENINLSPIAIIEREEEFSVETVNNPSEEERLAEWNAIKELAKTNEGLAEKKREEYFAKWIINSEDNFMNSYADNDELGEFIREQLPGRTVVVSYHEVSDGKHKVYVDGEEAFQVNAWFTKETVYELTKEWLLENDLWIKNYFWKIIKPPTK